MQHMSAERSCTNITSTCLNQSERNSVDVKGAQFIIQSNLKILSKAIQTIAKLAEDVYLEVSEAGLLFKSINRSKSMYSIFRFAPDFFNDCDMSLINTERTNVCRMTTKAAQFIFKGANFGEKNFQSCEFRIDPLGKTMGVKLLLNYDISRMIEVNLLETSGSLLRPLHDKTKFRNKTVVFASVLLPLLDQMRNEHEVTIRTDEKSLKIQNYSSSASPSLTSRFLNSTENSRNTKKVKTEAPISVDKLTRHQVAFNVELSFSLKDFLAVVTLAEQLSSEVCMYYDLPGKPLIVTVEAHTSFDIELLLATTTNDDDFEVDGGLFQEIDLTNDEPREINKTKMDKTMEKRGPIVKKREIGKKKQDETRSSRLRSEEQEDVEIIQVQTSSNPLVINEENEPEMSTNRTRNIDFHRIPSTESSSNGNSQNNVHPEESWRQNELRDPIEEVVEEPMNELYQDMFDFQARPQVQDPDPAQESSHMGLLNLDLGSDFHDEVTEQVAKRRKTEEFGMEAPKDARNRKLRRILMGSKRRDFLTTADKMADDPSTQRMSQQFQDITVVVRESQIVADDGVLFEETVLNEECAGEEGDEEWCRTCAVGVAAQLDTVADLGAAEEEGWKIKGDFGVLAWLELPVGLSATMKN